MGKLTLKTENQITGAMARVILDKSPINDLQPGSVILTLLQAAAQQDFAQYYQMLQIVRNYNLDTTTGTDLDNRAFEFGLTRKLKIATTGKVSILREEGFEKISTGFYTGFRSRIAGDTEIFVNNAEDFPESGVNTLIIGRNTPNEEEITYTGSTSNPDNQTNYYKITLDNPLTNDHALEEDVILKQGSDVVINAGTVIQVPATGREDAVTYTTTRKVTILAGEDVVEDVDIRATEPGKSGNASASAISGEEAFPSPPFPGARALNESAFSNGQNKETDTRLRIRIKAFIQALSQSTKAGITKAIQGLVDADTAKRVVSSNVILPNNVGLPVKVYIDDGTGFEPSFNSQGQETIISSAEGGEIKLQLDLFPLVKAQVETGNSEPYDMSISAPVTLELEVGNQSETLTFYQNEFTIPEASTAEEVVSAINNKSTLVEARTSQVGTKIVMNAKSDENEDIQVTGGSANTVDNLNFPITKFQTFYLYKNDTLLSKDGETALIDSSNTATYDFSGVDKFLEVIVDGKTANTQVVTIQESDFDSPAAAAQATAQQIADIINEQLAGAVASDNNNNVRLISNTKLLEASKIKINDYTPDPGGATDANVELGFDTTEVEGSDQDYTLNPELGVIDLVEPLAAYDKLTAGTRNTRAFLTATVPELYTLLGTETLQIDIDNSGIQTITLDVHSGSTAQIVADDINDKLVGGTAVTRTFGPDTYLEIRTNTLDESIGSIEITSDVSTNSIFGFITGVKISNIPPHTTSQVAQNSGPYAFIEGYTLVVVLDNDPTGKTFVITMDYDTEVTSGTSTSAFSASFLINVFLNNDELIDYWCVFKSGQNTTTGTITDVVDQTGDIFKYFYDTPPTDFANFAAGDQISFEDTTEAGNGGNFLIVDTATQNVVHADVLDKDISNPSSLTPSVGDRYLISADAGLSIHADAVLDKDVSNPSGLPAGRYIVDVDANDTSLVDVNAVIPSSSLATETHGNRYIIDRTVINTLTAVIRFENTPPTLGAGDAGNRYIVGTSPTGVWVGRTNHIAEWDGAAWVYTPSVSPPSQHDEVLVTDLGTIYYYGGSDWQVNDWTSHVNQIAEYNGIGTPGWLYTSPSDKEVAYDISSTDTYQFNNSLGRWEVNLWGGSAGKISVWNGSSATFSSALDQEVREVTDESENYQYDLATNLWTLNKWGGKGDQIGQWSGAVWAFTAPATNDVVLVADESETYQYNGSWSVFQFWVTVLNSAGVAETGGTGTGLIGQRRQISAYSVTAGGLITVGSAYSYKPSGTDEMILLPGTRQNVTDFFNNTKVTSLSSLAYIELAEYVSSAQKLQISSKLNGSDGYVQITGGRANNILQFSTTKVQGLRAYSHYIGLVKLVHQTIYGDETDLVTYPGVGAAGVKFQVLAPTVEEISFTLSIVTEEGQSLTNLESPIKSAVIKYINSLGVSGDVILARVVENVVRVNGVKDIEVTSPAANVLIAENELARTKASIISVN